MILIAGSTTSTISLPILDFCSLPGIGCGATRGARAAGVDGRTPRSIEAGQGVEDFLDGLRSQLKDRSSCPLPVRERMIPKTGGKLRRLGIATIADRVAQASLKLVLEPIFEADFLPCSYGFRPNRRAHDAVAEVRYLTSKSYDWIVEGGIKACFDEISHAALMDRVRLRIEDKRVLALVKIFLKAGILGEDRLLWETTAGTPQGSILSPLLSNVALSVLDEYVAQAPGGPSTGKVKRARRRRHGLPNYRLSRYADDWCLMVSGSRSDAETLREEIAVVLSTMGLRLSPEKTLITHIEDGLDVPPEKIQPTYLAGWTATKLRWKLTADDKERAALEKLSTDCSDTIVKYEVAP
ncbi:reverse transcriptase domain-containing protein [Streptomyces sp. NPDC052042]|uniref:reverse transcriptase domain-containing protein n=1 Tax=Streptomyces sp. NPDC052042 TaxID=3365683 RepID=UPI0037D04770